MNLVVDLRELVQDQSFNYPLFLTIMEKIRQYRSRFKMKIDCSMLDSDGGKSIVLTHAGETREIFIRTLSFNTPNYFHNCQDDFSDIREFLYHEIEMALKGKPCRTIKESYHSVDSKLYDCYKVIEPWAVVNELKRWNLSIDELRAFLDSIDEMDFYCCSCARKVFGKYLLMNAGI